MKRSMCIIVAVMILLGIQAPALGCVNEPATECVARIYCEVFEKYVDENGLLLSFEPLGYISCSGIVIGAADEPHRYIITSGDMVPETETLTEIIQDTNGEDMTVYVETYYVPYLILGDKDTHYPLEVYARSERNGLVMLSMSEAVDVYEPAELRVFTGSELIGEHAMLASFSLCTNIGEGFNDGWHDGYNNRISTGHSDILAVNGHDVTKCGQQIVMDLEATPGKYGGAIIDSEGRLLGIVCKSAVAEYEGYVCAVSSNEIIDFLNGSFYGNTNNEKETVFQK